jgi:hypothetical protein
MLKPGLIGMIPIAALHFSPSERARETVLCHVALSHLGRKMATAGALIADVRIEVLGGLSLGPVILGNPFAVTKIVGHDFVRLRRARPANHRKQSSAILQ